jgi:thioredoxin reductase (NADPH)
MQRECDLLIVGGGPAGLSAAINGASEGLRVIMLDAGAALGGQARESAAIENYPGFPNGITGDALMSAFVRQAQRFNAEMIAPLSAAALRRDGAGTVVTTDDYQEFSGRAVLLSNGLAYRRLTAEGIGPLMGRGVFYGMPPGKIATREACKIAVVGGANSAGQAAVKLAQNQNAHVRLIVRKTLAAQMSQYLIDRIRTIPNIEVCEGCEVKKVFGTAKLEGAAVHTATQCQNFDLDYMFIFIGALPRTSWLPDAIEMDAEHFIKTWRDTTRSDALPYETSLPGVFAAGDVRMGSTKRIASAIGEGAGALPFIHAYLAQPVRQWPI